VKLTTYYSAFAILTLAATATITGCGAQDGPSDSDETPETSVSQRMITLATVNFSTGAVGEFQFDPETGGQGYIERGPIGTSSPHFREGGPVVPLETFLALTDAATPIPRRLLDAPDVDLDDPRLFNRQLVDALEGPVAVASDTDRSNWYCGAPSEEQRFLSMGGCTRPLGTNHVDVCKSGANTRNLTWQTSRKITRTFTANCATGYPTWTVHQHWNGSYFVDNYDYYVDAGYWQSVSWTDDWTTKLRRAEIHKGVGNPDYYRGYIDHYDP